MKPIINTALCAFRLRASLGPGAQFAHLVFSGRLILLVANPTLGQAIADIGREGILQSDGTCVGSIMSSGFGLGPTAPGAPDGCVFNSGKTIGSSAPFTYPSGITGEICSTKE